MDQYIPQQNDRVKWTRGYRPDLGSAKGIVREVDLIKKEAIVTTEPSKYQAADRGGAQRTRHTKRFDQLTLVERPES